MVVTVKLFHCRHADHQESIAISNQNVRLNLALDFYFFGGLARAVIVYVRFYQERSFRYRKNCEYEGQFSATSGH